MRERHHSLAQEEDSHSPQADIHRAVDSHILVDSIHRLAVGNHRPVVDTLDLPEDSSMDWDVAEVCHMPVHNRRGNSRRSAHMERRGVADLASGSGEETGGEKSVSARVRAFCCSPLFSFSWRVCPSAGEVWEVFKCGMIHENTSFIYLHMCTFVYIHSVHTALDKTVLCKAMYIV